MKNTALLIVLLLLGLAGLSTGCSKAGTAQHEHEVVTTSSVSYPEKGNFRLSLTDAPHPSLTSVFVTIDHVELLLAKGGKEGRLILGQNMGTIDLLKLRDGVHLPIHDLDLQENVVVKQFRLVLKDEGHWLVRKNDGSTCDLKTPSQQKTGLKLIIPGGGVLIEAGSMYSLTVDFDVDHSIVDNKNNCLLKPVLKVKNLAKVPQVPDDSENPEDPEDPTEDPSDEPTDGGDSGSGDGSSGGDTGGSTGGDSGSDDGASGGDTGGSTGEDDSGDGSAGGDDGSGGDGSGSGSGDGSTGEDTGDGAPVIIEGNPEFFNSP